MPFYAEVDLVERDGTFVPDLPDMVTAFAVVDRGADGRVVVETDVEVPGSTVVPSGRAHKRGLGKQDLDPEFLSRALSRAERVEEKRMGRALTAKERGATQARSEKQSEGPPRDPKDHGPRDPRGGRP